MNVKEILYVISKKGRDCISHELWEFLKKQEEFFDARNELNQENYHFAGQDISEQEYEEGEQKYRSSMEKLQERYLKISLDSYHKIEKYSKEKGIASILVWQMDEYKDAFISVENQTGLSYMITEYLNSHFRISIAAITGFSDEEIVNLVNHRRQNL